MPIAEPTDALGLWSQVRARSSRPEKMARDKAALRAELADLDRRIAASPRGPGNAAEDERSFERRAEIERELSGIAPLERRFAGQGPGTQENERYYLLDYNLNGAGRTRPRWWRPATRTPRRPWRRTCQPPSRASARWAG